MHMSRPTTPRVQPIEKVAVRAREAMKDQPINAVNVTATMAHHRALSKAFGPFAQAVALVARVLLALRSASGLSPGPRVRAGACPDSVQPGW